MASQGIMSSVRKVGASPVCATSQEALKEEARKLGSELRIALWGACGAQG